MAKRLSQPASINVLIGNADWAWPQAVESIFQPRGMNALVAESPEEAVQLVNKANIHLAILDVVGPQPVAQMRDANTSAQTGLAVLKRIRQRDQLVPLLLLAETIDDRLLAQALSLEVFSVLEKPVDLPLLAAQIDRLFSKYYQVGTAVRTEISDTITRRTVRGSQRFRAVIKWTSRKQERSNDPDED